MLIFAVADDRVLVKGCMHSNLVCPPGYWLSLDQSAPL